YDWEIRQQPGDRRGVNDYDARNAWVDGDGHLHLLLTERDGRWTSAEVRTTRSFGYGTYSFELRDVSHVDPAAAVSVFTWDPLGADQNYREVRVDVGGGPDSANGQYVVPPETVPANVFRFAIPAGPVIHSFRWEPGRIAFKSVRRGAASRSDTVAERLFTSGIPGIGSERSYISLVYDRASAKPPS